MDALGELSIEYADRIPADLQGVLALVVPGAAAATVASPLAIGLAMPLLGGGVAEVWRTSHPVERGTTGPIVWSKGGDVLVGAMALADDGPIERLAEEAYRTMIAFVRESGFPNIVRMWNQFPRILVHDDGQERYQSFCAGRYAAFEAAGFTLDGDLPAASAVGAAGDGLVVTVVASRREVRYFENPRQMSAFRYPRQYGPKSPSFARASRVAVADGGIVFVSGTASIVGHASVHLGVAAAQVDETVENLRLVYGAAAGREVPRLADVGGALYRVYVKREEDFGTIRARFEPRIARDAACLWLRGDICRGELLVEIEMIAPA